MYDTWDVEDEFILFRDRCLQCGIKGTKPFLYYTELCNYLTIRREIRQRRPIINFPLWLRTHNFRVIRKIESVSRFVKG